MKSEDIELAKRESLVRAELEQWHAEFGPDVKLATKEFDQIQSTCAELKTFIGESEMPMHTSFSDTDSIAWRKRREYLLSNKAGEQLLERLNKAKDLVQRCVDTGLLRTDETRQLWDDANEFLE